MIIIVLQQTKVINNKLFFKIEMSIKLNMSQKVSSSNNRRGGGGSGIQVSNVANSTSISRTDLLKYKEIKVRKWGIKPLVFYTLNGTEVQLPSWQSSKLM
jgi:hypothetical protein